ncbi:hypothetical protein G3N59_26030 [Paraburkholderia sp. Ac-20340]|uniref:hypothetical protein n=1 Tax=Paraburkholderia sp. Ac-20340 TaxID=2703888 RepID=UPI0019802EF5|nr:hypothetical protein [Paraburkholderia sp. Ac-20340]MBN3856844.1 hypothetical protein [Paraburkholderia sp. Ac-20340]
MQKTQMTEEQQSKLLHLTALGLQWVRGDIEFSKIEKYLGEPTLRSDQLGKVEYFYFIDNIMSITFTWYRNDSDELHEPSLGDFNIKIEKYVDTNIPYETFDTIGLNRVQRGARIDASHVEKRDFFAPIGVLEMTNALPINSVSFLYSQLMPENSPYDIYAGFNYLADLFRETGPWDLSIVRKAVNLRKVSIVRIHRYP